MMSKATNGFSYTGRKLCNPIADDGEGLQPLRKSQWPCHPRAPARGGMSEHSPLAARCQLSNQVLVGHLLSPNHFQMTQFAKFLDNSV